MQSIDIILPIKIEVYSRGPDLTRVVRGLLPSLEVMKFLPHIINAYIICSSTEMEIIRERLQEFPSINFVYVDEGLIFSAAGLDGMKVEGVDGWFRQQVLKLGVFDQFNIDRALIFDSDVVCSSEYSIKLFSGPLCPFHNLGPSGSESWYRAAADKLGLSYSEVEKRTDWRMGVTPELLIGEHVRSLLVRLREFDRDWGAYLTREKPDYSRTWTEYTLYWSWLAASGISLEDTYFPCKMYQFVEGKEELATELSKVFSKTVPFSVLQSNSITLGQAETVYAWLDSLKLEGLP